MQKEICEELTYHESENASSVGCTQNPEIRHCLQELDQQEESWVILNSLPITI